MAKNKIVDLLVFLFCVSMVWGQDFVKTPETRNAALRYWLAFANMEDHPAGEATTRMIDQVLSGNAVWDEPHLGPILNGENGYAVKLMQQASSLPECDWGLDYAQGSAMNLAHLPKARAMARLNALYGARMWAKGDYTGAVDSWLAGLRFGNHMTSGGSLIAPLSAKPMILLNLRFLSKAVRSGKLSAETQMKINATLNSLPKEGLDWETALRYEAWAGEQDFKELAEGNFTEKYKEMFPHSSRSAHPPTAADVAQYRSIMKDVVAAFEMPYAQTKTKLEEANAKLQQASDIVRDITPNYLRLNESREQVIQAREELANLLADKGHIFQDFPPLR